jgi:hypothetical protein
VPRQVNECYRLFSTVEQLRAAGRQVGPHRMTGYDSLVQLGESAANDYKAMKKACRRILFSCGLEAL